MIRIIVESHIPYIKGLLEPMARVEYLDTCDITAAAVRDADALLVRTRTRCDASLLEGSRVRFIGTATIGTDHIDLDYCRERGIEVVNAPGCNAPAVAQWVHAALGCWLGQMPVPVHGPLTLGVVGVGHVGSIVARWGRELGYRVLQCDPPRAAAEGSEGFVTLDQVKAQSDVVTFHTPLTREGQWATFHMCDAQFLAQAPHLGLVMNAARGAVCDNSALAGWAGDVAIDCWEHEPAIDRQLLAKALVATPHIAGYSSDGKHRGTAMVVEALNRHFGFHARPVQAQAPASGASQVTLERIMRSYDPMLDTARLKACPHDFERLRNNYDLRPEVM